MYSLVADIGAYPEFLPWCSGSEILSEDEDEVSAVIHVSYSGLNKAFTTRNRLQKNKIMEIRLVEGPFSHLHGYWQFQELDEEASKIVFDLEFSFSTRMMSMMVGPVFTRIADGMVDSFCKRAESLYGKR
jgi:ribosome-associated toxin RatA of RatAB toxin-antitoxin module